MHLGLGGFHRAHQAIYFDDLAGQRVSASWGIAGVSLRRLEVKAALDPQDGLFTVLERDEERESARIVGSVVRCLAAAAQPLAVIERLADPRTRLVTLTITADGYDVDRFTRLFKPAQETLRRELDSCLPSTAYGFIVEALARRRANGVAPFTVLSCDNLPDSGACARTAVVSFAKFRDESLATWIERNVAFPNSMVDRITPQTTPADRDRLANRFGVSDSWPVVTESFSQWIIEDAFCNDRPPLDLVGAQFVSDVGPHKLVKTRMLNGSHCALAYLGLLCGHETTSEAMDEEILAQYIDELLRTEVAPQLPGPPGLDLDHYSDALLRRLSNSKIADQLARLGERGSTKLPSYLLPSLTDAINRGSPHRLLTLAVAAWVRYLAGRDDCGQPLEVRDGQRAVLQPLAQLAAVDPRPLLEQSQVFGALAKHHEFCSSLRTTIGDLVQFGTRDTLKAYLQSDAMMAA